MPTVVSMDTQWVSGGRVLGKPASTGLCDPGGMSDEQGPLAFVRFRDGCDPPTHPREEMVQVRGGLAPRFSRSLSVSCGGSSVREASVGPDVRPAEMPPLAKETASAITTHRN
jgi:hypothetical protein